MSNRGAIFNGVGLAPAISFAEMNQAQANRQHLELQKKQYEREQQNHEAIRKQANSTYLSNALDKKDFLSGSPYDPQIVGGLDGLMKQGMDLAQKGADTPTIMMAIGPGVAKLNQYQQTAKQIEAGIKNNSDKLKQYPGYNLDAINGEAKKLAYYNEDGTLKDISQVDPTIDYTTMAINKHPDRVTTTAGLDNVIAKTIPSETSEKIATEYRGRRQTFGYDIKKPFWMDLEKDEFGNTAVDPKTLTPKGLDVRNQILKDDKGSPRLDENGNPYRIVDKKVFNAFMAKSPDVAHAIEAETIRSYREAGAKENEIPPIGSPEFEEHARHSLYTLLKEKSQTSFKRNDVQSNSAILNKIELTGSAFAPKKGSGSSESPQINDVYKEIEHLASGTQPGHGAPFNELSTTAQTLLLDMARKMTGDKDLSQADVYIMKEPDGKISIRNNRDNALIAPITYNDINTKVNKGVKATQEVLKNQPKEPTYNYKGKTYTESQVKVKAEKSGMTVEEYKKELGIK